VQARRQRHHRTRVRAERPPKARRFVGRGRAPRV